MVVGAGNSPIHAPTDDQRSDGCVIRKPARAAYVSTEGQYALASDDHHGFVVWKVCLDETLPEDTPPCAVQFEVTMDEASEEVLRHSRNLSQPSIVPCSHNHTIFGYFILI